jgi:hypothetical protein
MSTPTEYELDIYRQVEEYILDLENSPNFFDKQKANTLSQNLHNIPHECREGFVKFIKNGWVFLNVAYLNRALLGTIDLVFLDIPSKQAVRLNQDGRVVGILPVKMHHNPNLIDAEYDKKWKNVDYSVDEFLDYFNMLQKLDKSDVEAIENL